MDPILSSLMLSLDGLSDEDAERMTYQEYIRLYVDRPTHTGGVGQMSTHDGEPVVFYDDRFIHAFFKSVDKTSRKYNKGEFDRLRGERVRWIGQVIQGSLDHLECWSMPSDSSYNRSGQKSLERMYLIPDERYVVWLVPRRDGGWKFSTAYVAGPQDIKRYNQKGRCFWNGKKIPRD